MFRRFQMQIRTLVGLTSLSDRHPNGFIMPENHVFMHFDPNPNPNPKPIYIYIYIAH